MVDQRNAKALIAAASPTVPVATPATTQEATMENAKIDAFVTAQLSVTEIHRSYAPAFEAAGTEEEMLRVRQQATEDMMVAVNETPGITVEEFNAIIDAASADPRLADQLNEALATALR